VAGLTLALVVAAGSASQAGAQPTDTLVGSTVELIDVAGGRVRARLLELGRDEVIVADDRQIRRYRWDTLDRVYRIERDSVRNGTLIGVAAGFATGLIATGAICGTVNLKDECGAIGFGALTLPGAGIGAGVGALVDLAIPKRTLVFGAGTRSIRASWSADVGAATAGVRATLTFP
jgi:hypothetical protein